MCRHPPRSTRPAPPFPYTPRFRSPERRKPLAGLKGAAQLLARRADNRVGNEEERELIALIGSEVDRLAALLDRLLSPAPPRPHAPLNIHAVLERVLRLAESDRSEEHTSELQSLMRISYAVFCLQKTTQINHVHNIVLRNMN